MRKILRDRAVGASLVSGLIVAAMAMLAADRVLLAFAAVAVA